MHMQASRHVAVPCDRAFAVLADIERYPEFLPGWEAARILERRDDRLEVEQTVRAGPVPVRFRTSARLYPPHRLHIEGIEGPFHRLHIDWTLAPDPGKGCRIRLEVDVAVRFGPLSVLVERGFRHQARTLLDHFERRLEALASGT